MSRIVVMQLLLIAVRDYSSRRGWTNSPVVLDCRGRMFAEIIAIGSELTCGSKLDTNSQWLSHELESLGWTVARHTTLADGLDAMVGEFRAAASRSQVVLISGGLGPTLDDITRDALALAFHQQLVRDPESLMQIQELFAARGREMPQRNERQADRPQCATALPNSCGTAPGILMRVTPSGAAMDVTQTTLERHASGCLIAVMPGVPAEMKPMFLQQVRPILLDSGIVMRRAVIRTFGFGESDAELLLGDLTARDRNPEVGITASEAVISLWVTARSTSETEAEHLCQETCQLIRERLGDAVYAESDAELHDVIADLFSAKNRSVALVEGGTTGGQIAMWMSETPAAAAVVRSAIVIPGPWNRNAFHNAGIEWSEPTGNQQNDWLNLANNIGENIRLNHNVDFVLISSPFYDDPLDSGVIVRRGHVAVRTENEMQSFDVSMSGNLAIFRQRAARTALNRLRLIVQQESLLPGAVQ
ncbi:MAG: molybdopterin-binding protein [Planctomycetota bacterium]|nr:molybdopterin-binding protein [Planctomycetota bacterium]